MMKHSFTVGGVDMRERFGLLVERFEDKLTPRLRPRKVVVPERDGAHDFGATYYEERELTIACASGNLSREACRELSAIVARKARIIRWDEPDKYYVGRVYEPVDIERIAGTAKRFALVFTCDPFAYGNTVYKAMPTRMEYLGTARTPTRITITNTGTTPLQGLRMVIRVRRDVY